LQGKLTILEQRELAANIFEMTLTGRLVRKMTTSGQFLNIKIPQNELLLRRPISLHEINHEDETCKIIYRIEGSGTQILSTMAAGAVLDALGPLGNGFDISEIKANEEVLIVGGGIGTPPLYQLAREVKRKGAKVTVVLGFASKAVSFHIDKFKALGDVLVSTDDGSLGSMGHVGLVIDKLLKTQQFDAVYACGAKGLLKYVDERFRAHPRAYISVEARMACGIGACYACVCPVYGDNTGTQTLKVCDQGPIFATGKVVLV
jgi:dihydroorotate dehydrogenase electron transfer subunit